VQQYIQSRFQDQSAEAEIRGFVTEWRDNDAKLHPLIERSFLLKEVAPLSADLASVGTAGLAALNYLDKSEVSPDAWRTQQLALLDSAVAPKANLLLTIVAPVRQLVEATGTPAPQR